MIYFDNAATSGVKPSQVISAISNALEKYSANPGRSGHALSFEASHQVYSAREKLDSFFNGYGSEFVSFTSNCTEALNIAIKGVLKGGDHVVISCLEHNSVVRPIYKLHKEIGVEYSIFDVYEDEMKTLRSFESSFRKNTKLCVVTAVSNVFGTILPLASLSAIAHSRGALFFVDGAQAAGVIPVDMKNQGIDCLCVPGHKGLLGPMGIGAIIHNNLDFTTIIEGGTGTASFDYSQPSGYPERLESGTLNVPGICGLSAGIDWVNDYTCHRIFNKETALAKSVSDGLSLMKNVILYGDLPHGKHRAPVISFNVKGLHSEQVSLKLNDGGVAVRGGYHCAGLAHRFMGTEATGTVRVSPSVFNSEKDVNILLNLVENIAF